MKGKSGIFFVIGLALFALVVIFLTFSSSEKDNAENFNTALPDSEYLSQEPYLTSMYDLEGNEVDMDKDKLVFLNVWATWCGPCVLEMPSIQSLYERYKSNGNVQFYIVSDEDAETILPFIARRGYDLPFYIYDKRFPRVLDGTAIPRTYIVYKGRILAQHIGAANWDTPEIHELIEAALQDS